MGRKLEVTASEMLELRKQGYSNKDICNILEISLPTVLRYIGKQGGRMDSVTKDPSRSMEIRPPEKSAEDIKILSRTFAIGGFLFCDNAASDFFMGSVSDQEQSMRIPKDDIDNFIAALEKAKRFIGR